MNVNFLHNIYQKSLTENERNTNFWEKYIENLDTLDFKTYDEKLTVPALIPIGSRLLFRGELRHTNEITVALGADYFVTCSLAQAEVLRKHRIEKAKSTLNLLKKEKEYLENQISFGKQAVDEDEGHDIIEVCTDEEDKAWRKQHRERVKQYMQSRDKSAEKTNEITDEELWDRLEELELQEELQNELSDLEKEDEVLKDDIEELSSKDESSNNEMPEKDDENVDSDDDSDDDVISDYSMPREELAKKIRSINETYSQQTLKPSVLTQPKLELMNEMVERHKIITETLKEYKKKRDVKCKNVDDLLHKMEELEEAEELEDEMDRIEDIMNDGNVQDNDDEAVEEGADSKLKKSVSYADEDFGETLEITFKHSDVEPTNEPYDPEKGILKPSDIYEPFCKKHIETASILKRTTNYTASTIPIERLDGPEQETHVEKQQKTIIIKDIFEKVDQNDNNTNKDGRPMSLFKKRRQQQKS